MDSITHLFLGAALAAALAPPRHRRAALLAGAALNTLPDLDVIPLWLVADPVANMTWHRGPTHSLFVLLPFAVLLWAWFRGQGGRVAEAPRRWLAVCVVCLLSHPLIDAFTVYGTQLWWPLPVRPAMWSLLFIIDPLVTLPLLAGAALAWWWNWTPRAQRALVTALAFVGVYLGWAAFAKAIVEHEAERALAARGLQDAPRFSVPMPFTTLLWRVVVLTPDGFLEGERSLVADRRPMAFREYRSDTVALAQVSAFPAVARLSWFSHGFLKAHERDGQLVLSDLRMGAEPDYSFRFAVAQAGGDGWRDMPVQQLRWPWEARRRLGGLWHRIWNEPAEEES
jgi:inner membrane protein